MTSWIDLIIAVCGGGGLLSGLAGGIYGYRGRQANYAQATAEIGSRAADIAGRVAADLRVENAELKSKVGLLDTKVDGLQDSMYELREIVLFAIFRLERNGDSDGVNEIQSRLATFISRPSS